MQGQVWRSGPGAQRIVDTVTMFSLDVRFYGMQNKV
jgi:hypothetical protein